ncbi:MAG: hypothetical protein ACOYNN_17110 [Terrimicrobiaceae bacterium]|jgi:hypothetical protein
MTVAVTTLRSTLATALESAGVWQVFSYPPASPIANSVIVQPDDPYIEPSNNIYSSVAPKVNFKIIMIVPMFDNQGNLNGIEDMVVGVFNKLAASTTLKISVGNTSAPSVLAGVAGEMLTSEMSVSIMTSWS